MLDYAVPALEKKPETPNRAFQLGEVGKVRFDVLRFCTGIGLDLGCGPWPLAGNVIAIDRCTSGMFGHAPGQNINGDIEKLPLFASTAFDFVFSSHALEDIQDWQGALREWWRVLKDGGRLVLYMPHADLYTGENTDHQRDFRPEDIRGEMEKVGGWDLLVDEVRDQEDEYSFLQVYRKRKDKRHTYPCHEPKPEKTCGVIRYGGSGDHIMAAALLPALKRDGYHVTYITNPAGEEVMRHDPHIDEFWTDTAGLVNQDLLAYWKHLEKRFDKLVNVMDAVENGMLPQPGTPQHRWNNEARKMLFDFPYLDYQSVVTQVPMDNPPRAYFYPNEGERKWAKKEKKRLSRGGPVIAWALAGSAVHKVSPFTAEAVQQVLDAYPDAVVVTLGGQKETALYQDFQDNDRHVKKAGEWSVRESLAFVTVADLVVGPETGALNAAGMLETSKVVWLSHSSPSNLVAHWKNCMAVVPDTEVAPCYPCHVLHWGWDACQKGPHGAALCVEGIPADQMAGAVIQALEQSREQSAA